MKHNIFLKGIAVIIMIAMIILVMPLGSVSAFATVNEDRIYLDTPVQLYDHGDDLSRLYFTPEVSGVYCFRSYCSDEYINCYGYIEDEEGNVLADDASYFQDFAVFLWMDAGATYVLCSYVSEHNLGNYGEYSVSVSKSNVVSVEISDTFVIENCDSYVATDFNEDTWEYDLEWVKYDYYPVITVTFEDGTVEQLGSGHYDETFEVSVDLNMNDSQSYSTPWATGNTYEVTGSFYGITDTFNVEVIETPVDHLEISPVNIIEGDYNGSAGEYTDDDEYVEYEYYDPYPAYTVYFKDGSVESIDAQSYVSYNGRSFSLNTWTDQSYDNQWGVGEHSANANLMGFESTFTVNIIETPIIALSVDNISIARNTNGFYTSDWDENGNLIDWYCYNIGPGYTVTYADGTTEYFGPYEGLYFNGQEYWLSIYHDQASDNQWDIGEHTATANLFGIKADFTVEIIESPVVSLEIEDVTLEEGAHSSISYDFDENGNLRYYCSYNYNPLCTVTFDDGRTEQVYLHECIEYNGESYYISAMDDQGLDNNWGVGEHTVVANFMGYETTFTVEITESPIVAVYVEDTSLVYRTGGDYIYTTDDEGNSVYRYHYFYYPNYTVVFNDGSTQSLSYNKNAEFNGKYYSLTTIDSQSYQDWEVGKHTAYAIIGGLLSSFTVEIKESPIVGIVYKNVELIENLNGRREMVYNPETDEYDIPWFYYEYIPSCVVLLNDGTVLYSDADGAVEYCGETYWIDCTDTQEASQWGVGTHTVTASLLGQENTFNVTVKESPYKCLEISGTNELWLTFFKNDGTTESVKATAFDSYFWMGELYGTLKTTGGSFVIKGNYYLSDDEKEHPDINLTISIGDYTSNILDGNLWMYMMMLSTNYESNINMYRWLTGTDSFYHSGCMDMR